MDKERVTWAISGIRPLMQNNPAATIVAETDQGAKKTPVKKSVSPFEEAKAKLYGSNGHFYVPGQAFWKAMVEACPGTKIGKQAASGILPPAIEPAEEEVILYDPATLHKMKPRALGEKDWVVDSRMIVTKKQGKEIALIVSRPKWRQWGCLLVLEVDREVIPVAVTDVITSILNIAGQRGICSGRLRRPKGTSEWVGIRMGKFTAELLK